MKPQKLTSAAFALVLGLSFAAAGCEDTGQSLGKSPACTTPTGSKTELTPASVRELLLSGNAPILYQAVQVHKAKENVNLSRAKLFPSLNLGMALGSALSPNFLVTSVEYLLPFLVPARWSEASRARHLLEAEKSAFVLTSLNQYSSAYALYLGLDRDIRTHSLLMENYEDSLRIEQIVRDAYEVGHASAEDLDLARAQSLTAKIQANQLKELVADELANTRMALGLCPEVTLEVASHDLPASELEGMSVSEATALANEKAVEAQQMRALVEAARSERWSKVFAFVGPVSAGSSISGMVPGESLSLAFSDLTARGSLNFGADYFPALSLSNLQLKELALRQREVELEIGKILDSTLGRLPLSQEKLESATQATEYLERVYEAQKLGFWIGDVTLRELIESQGRLRQMKIERLIAETDLKLLRLSLHRLMSSEEFAPIPEAPVSPADMAERFGAKPQK